MNIMSIDCEFNQPSTLTIQIGCAVYSVRSGELLEKWETYVDPGEPILPFITELTGITDADVKGAPKIKEAYMRLKEIHKKHKCFMNPLVWGSGVRNDSLSIYEESEVEEPNFMGYRVLDAKTIYQSKMMFQNNEIRGGLKKACDNLGIGFEGTAHTALADAVNTFRLWHHLMGKFQK